MIKIYVKLSQIFEKQFKIVTESQIRTVEGKKESRKEGKSDQLNYSYYLVLT